MSEKAPVVRLDRSREFSTVHGERAPGDPLAGVCFYQEGLPFDSSGILLPHAIDKEDKRLRALVEKKVARATKAMQPRAEGEAADEEDADGEDTSGVNLESWLRGEAEYAWFAVSAAIAKAYGRKGMKMADAVAFLVDEKRLIPFDQVAPRLRGMISGAS